MTACWGMERLPTFPERDVLDDRGRARGTVTTWGGWNTKPTDRPTGRRTIRGPPMRHALTAAALLLAVGAAVADPPKWNLLVVTADDLNADSAGWAGNRLGATPNLDAF